MQIPSDRLYTKDHEWIMEQDGCFIVGITEFAQSELGELVFIEFPKKGVLVKIKDTLCVVESTKAASDVYAPVSGKIVDINEDLTDNPVLVNTDPYNTGWLVKLEDVSKNDLAKLLSAEQYEKLLNN